MIVVIGRITQAISVADFVRIQLYLLVLIILIVANYLTKVFYRPTNFRILRDVTLYLDQTYLKKFIMADNNQIEKIGT